jgi:hypothetical protein
MYPIYVQLVDNVFQSDVLKDERFLGFENFREKGGEEHLDSCLGVHACVLAFCMHVSA